MIDFNDTELAFRDKSLEEVKNAYWLFRLVGNPFLVKLGALLLRFALSVSLPVEWLLKPTVFAHFCGGESIKDSENTIRRLEQSGIQTILDFSAEGRETESDFEHTFKQIHLTLKKASEDRSVPYAVFKPTGLARVALLRKCQQEIPLSDSEISERSRFIERMYSICETGSEMGIPVMIDAEESWIQTFIDREVEQIMFRFNKNKPLIFNTLQMYRYDRLDYLHDFVAKAKKEKIFSAFKLVRGAYMEKERERAAIMKHPSPIYPNKRETDEAFDEATRFCLENINHVAVCIGTHNEMSCAKAAGYMKEFNIPPDHPNVSFSQLLGMSDHISYMLAAEGYNVSKYVPYGLVKTVVPYLIRRSEENTSVAGQTSRELSLIRSELARRRG